MNLKLNDSEEGRCVIFEGSMICKNSRAIERFILDMVRRDRHLKVDLSKVREVDRCGIHLLAMIKSFGSEFVEIVATSPVVDVAMVHIPATRRKQQPVKSPPMPLTAYVSPVAAALSV
jgi:hypothetical protein